MDNLNLFIEIIANRDAEKTNPINREFKYPTFYKYYEDVEKAADARNAALKRTINPKYSSFDLFAGHDYDDTYVDKLSLDEILSPIVKNSKLHLCFGNAVFSYENDKFKKLYKNHYKLSSFLKTYEGKDDIYDTLISYISKYHFFPSQAAIFKRSIALEIGGFPECKSLEDRIFAIKYLLYLKKQNLEIKFVDKPTINYNQHNGSESVENHKNGIRNQLIQLIRDWYSLYKKDAHSAPDIYDYIHQ